LDELELLKVGPASIKRRVRSLNGDLTIDSRPGRGAGLKIRVPAA
jgi:signal transduction histidine kinase